MSNVEVFNTTFAVTILVIMAVCIPTALLLANWFLHPGKIKGTAIKGTSYECGLAHGGWELLLVLLGFLVILEAGYLYVFRKGVLDWATLKD